MRFASLLALATLLSACATLTAESDQVITVATNPPGARCVVSNTEGTGEIAQTPGTVTVTRAFAPLTVACSKPGVGSAVSTIEAKTRGRAYGNVLLLGLPAIVDASTGKGYVYDPENVTLTLTR